MLLRIILENFLSFDKAQEFNMFPNLNRKELIPHVYQGQHVALLKQAAIYGSNASGKSNLIKGLAFIREFALKEKALDPMLIERLSYRLNSEENIRPVEILLEFQEEGGYFIYDVAWGKEGIEREELYLSGLGKRSSELLYSRRLDVVNLGERLLEQAGESWEHTQKIASQMLLESYRYASFLSLLKAFPLLSSKELDSARVWFSKKLKVVNIHSEFEHLIARLYNDNDLLQFYNKVFGALSIGIDGVDVKSTDAEEWLSNNPEVAPAELIQNLEENEALDARTKSNRPVLSAIVEDGRKKVLELVFRQASQEQVFYLDVRDQSDGTIRILTLLPAIKAVMESECVVVIDEINHCLHTELVLDLVRLFSSSPTKGQLIFSTHDTELMERRGVLRQDEIWLVEKKDGASQLTTLNDFDIPESLTSVSRGYREGRFGGSYSGNLMTLKSDEKAVIREDC